MSAGEFTRSLAAHPEGVLMSVWAVAGASRTEVSGMHSDGVRIRVAAPPAKGRANQAITALLAGVFDTPVELVAGAASRRKRLLIRGLSVIEAAEALSRATKR